MFRHLTLCLLLLAGLAAFAATNVVVNGKTVDMPVLSSNGKMYIGVADLIRLLGGTVSFDAAANKLVINVGTADAAESAQLAGDNGELNKIYSLVKSNPIHFSLLSAEYTTTPFTIGTNYYVPKADEKLLVLHFTVQNPQDKTNFVRYDRLRITAVDAMNVNHEAVQGWGDEENKGNVALELKPKQKLACYAGIIVPAKGVVPKLMIMPWREGDGPILRYDMRDKINPLPTPFPNPADATGATALEIVPAELGKAYPYANFDMAVEKFNYIDTKIGDTIAPPAGGRFLIVTMLVKNRSPRDAHLRQDFLKPYVTDTDGAEVKYRGMLLATRDANVAQDLKPGAELRVRLFFAVEKGSTPVKMLLNENNKTRDYEFAIP
ncbi:MAG: DUF4352 domain-containing protein [Armatimonadota bacterium]